MKKITVNIIGGGLAGCEATYQLAKRGISVRLFEQKPTNFSPAHTNSNLAEIVCSNSLKSTLLSSASGMLKAELELLDCKLLEIAKECSVPAGSALAVDREKFSESVTKFISSLPNVEVIRQEVTSIDLSLPTIIATGPLTSGNLFSQISNLLGEDALHFYDASAPIVDGSTIDKQKTFDEARYGKGANDYINCPMNKDEYYNFVNELTKAERAELHDFEQTNVFEGCMPIEIMAARGKDTLRFGPLRPVGFVTENGKRPYAVVQLRRENTTGELYNIVGFQTNLKFSEQKRVFSLIPALSNADFVKYGVMHRNSYICAPKHLLTNFALKNYNNIYFAGQISGVEGYVESIASGLVSAIDLYCKLTETTRLIYPKETMIGSLINYLCTADATNFQPMNSNFGILPPLQENIKDKAQRKLAYTIRGIDAMKEMLSKSKK